MNASVDFFGIPETIVPVTGTLDNKSCCFEFVVRYDNLIIPWFKK